MVFLSKIIKRVRLGGFVRTVQLIDVLFWPRNKTNHLETADMGGRHIEERVRRSVVEMIHYSMRKKILFYKN